MKARNAEQGWEIVDRGWYAVMDFRGERRRRSAEARDLHAGQPGAVRIVDEQGAIVHRNTYGPGDLRDMAELWAIVGEWPATEVYVKGVPATARSVEEFLACYVEKVITEGRPHPHCADMSGHPSHVGCRDRHVALDLRRNDRRDVNRPYWFEFAQARTPTDWRVHTDRIRHFLEPLGPRRGCPALQETARWIDQLPTAIEVPGSGIWRVVRTPEGPALSPRDRDRYAAWLRVALGEEPMAAEPETEAAP